VLGPTDPSKAPGGTVRRDFGSNVMVNTAHASDSPASVEREMKIIRIHQNSMAARIREFLEECK
jgi:nucleoside diphosphate kinase